MNLFSLGDFVLNSGAKSRFKIECDMLTDGDIACLAHMIQQMVGPFSSVEGVPRGGFRLAEALQPYTTMGIKDNGHLIVDDVLTTGGSMEKARLACQRVGRDYPCCESARRIEAVPGDATTLIGGECPIHGRIPVSRGAVIFARGQCPHWIKPLFQMPECFWTKPKHR